MGLRQSLFGSPWATVTHFLILSHSFSPPLFYPQRIAGSQLSSRLQYFGQSLSGGQDLTMDGLVDLAVGAQGHVLLLRWELLSEHTRCLPSKEQLCCLKAPDGPLVSLQVPACAESWGDHGVHTQGIGKECVWVSWTCDERPDCWGGQSLPPCSQEHTGPAERRWGWGISLNRLNDGWPSLFSLLGSPKQSPHSLWQPSCSDSIPLLGGEAQQTPSKKWSCGTPLLSQFSR